MFFSENFFLSTRFRGFKVIYSASLIPVRRARHGFSLPPPPWRDNSIWVWGRRVSLQSKPYSSYNRPLLVNVLHRFFVIFFLLQRENGKLDFHSLPVERHLKQRLWRNGKRREEMSWTRAQLNREIVNKSGMQKGTRLRSRFRTASENWHCHYLLPVLFGNKKPGDQIVGFSDEFLVAALIKTQDKALACELIKESDDETSWHLQISILFSSFVLCVIQIWR